VMMVRSGILVGAVVRQRKDQVAGCIIVVDDCQRRIGQPQRRPTLDL